ncbi:hypothetical protein P43SY_007285 [Pythium insidiosum]|uniref:Apple domain-containing protein n=1 Tax=Pythium insidiosum TaxID=114742 RepID=A0AAD5LBE9_PYTIN|nr:hypothetical protein P43SY_007285 [Pythium insidiosum]
MSGLVAIDSDCMRGAVFTTRCRNAEGVALSLCVVQMAPDFTCRIREECRISDPAPVHVSCRAQYLYDTVSLPSSLQSLDLGENFLILFRPDFPRDGKPPQLKQLNLEKTGIAGMEEIHLPPSAEELTLDSTQIVDLVFHDNLLSLRKLSIRNSALNTIDNVRLPPKLEILDVEGSKIETLVLHDGLANLRVLRSSAANIETLRALDLSTASHLELLDLSTSRVSSIIGVKLPPRLTHVDLGNSNVDCIVVRENDLSVLSKLRTFVVARVGTSGCDASTKEGGSLTKVNNAGRWFEVVALNATPNAFVSMSTPASGAEWHQVTTIIVVGLVLLLWTCWSRRRQRSRAAAAAMMAAAEPDPSWTDGSFLSPGGYAGAPSDATVMDAQWPVLMKKPLKTATMRSQDEAPSSLHREDTVLDMSGLLALDSGCLRAPHLTTLCRNAEGVALSLCIVQMAADWTCRIREACRITDPVPVHVSCRGQMLIFASRLPSSLQSLDLGDNRMIYFTPTYLPNDSPPQLTRLTLDKNNGITGMESIFTPPSAEELTLDSTQIVDLVFHDNLLTASADEEAVEDRNDAIAGRGMRAISVLLTVLAAASGIAATDRLLTAQEIAALEAELNAWKQSPAGQTAARLGFLPTNAAPSPHGTRRLSDDPLQDDHLQRLLASKRRMAEIQVRQPRAILSMDTPLALMTPKEYETFATGGRSIGRLHRELQAVNVSSSIDITPQLVHQRVLQTAPTRPKEVDWQKEGCVTPIKNQNICDFCWAFATVGTLETAACVHYPGRKLVELSEQDLVSCSTPAGRCNWGGFSRDGFDWITHTNGGTVCTAASMPYVAPEKRVTCPNPDPVARCERPKIDAVTYVNMDYPNHEDLETVIATRGAVAASLTSKAPVFQFYRGGLLMGDKDGCPSGADHEVVIVGYGERDGVKYWKVKNQWDTWWGDQGYAYLERGYQGGPYGTCGIEGWSTYPIFRDEIKYGLDRKCQKNQDGVELLGKDLKVVRAFEYSKECCDICRFEPGCVGVTWHPDSPGSVCVLKATIEGTRPYRDGRGGHVVLEGSAPPTTPAPTTQPTPVDPTKCANVQENIDLPGNDLANAKAATVGDCCKLCSETHKCVAYTWSRYNGGTCFMKHTKSARPVYSSPSADGSPYLVSGEVYRCQALQKDVDFPGEDMANAPGLRAEDCCAKCRKTDGCAAFSWSGYNGGTCWLKRRAAAGVAKQGVVSAVAK